MSSWWRATEGIRSIMALFIVCLVLLAALIYLGETA